MAGGGGTSSGKGVPLQGLQNSSCLYQQGRRTGRGPGAPSGHLSLLGQSQANHLDPQDQRTDGKRFHIRCQGRPCGSPVSRFDPKGKRCSKNSELVTVRAVSNGNSRG